jgi:hypothetical protein
MAVRFQEGEEGRWEEKDEDRDVDENQREQKVEWTKIG